MGRKSKTLQLTSGIAGQHLALSVAAHLARTQVVPDPMSVYDGQHLIEMINLVATALVRVTPVYVYDTALNAPRQLAESELPGAQAKRGATNLVLRDGRTLAGVTIKRADLRRAIAILKATGIPELTAPAPAADAPAPARSRLGDLGERLSAVERLLEGPLLAEQLARATALIVPIARHAPPGPIANLAMHLMSAINDARSGAAPEDRSIALLLARLRDAVDEAQRA